MQHLLIMLSNACVIAILKRIFAVLRLGNSIKAEMTLHPSRQTASHLAATHIGNPECFICNSTSRMYVKQACSQTLCHLLGGPSEIQYTLQEDKKRAEERAQREAEKAKKESEAKAKRQRDLQARLGPKGDGKTSSR